jgi:signal transduction histidine kinase
LEVIEDSRNDFLSTVIHPDDLPYRVEALHQWLPVLPNKVLIVELRMRGAKGEWRWFRSHHVVFNRNAQGEPTQLLIHSRDITTQKESDAKNIQLALQRERMALVTRFILALSHEFRTSLATIETSRYLADRHLSAGNHHMAQAKLDTIKYSVERMGEQLQNLYMVNSLSEPEFNGVDIQILIQDSIQQLNSHASKKHIWINFQRVDNVPLVLGDTDKLRTAIHHLVLNAVSYTPND